MIQFAHTVTGELITAENTFDVHIGMSHGRVLCVNASGPCPPTEDVPFGDESAQRVAEEQRRFEFFIAGEPMNEAGRSLDCSTGSGQILVSENTFTGQSTACGI